MSDSLAGLTRRVSNRAYDQETASELSHILDEAREHGGDAADALIELTLAVSTDANGVMSDDDYDAVMDSDDDQDAVEIEYVDDGGAYSDADEDGLGDDLDDLEADVGGASGDEDAFSEAFVLGPGEVRVF